MPVIFTYRLFATVFFVEYVAETGENALGGGDFKAKTDIILNENYRSTAILYRSSFLSRQIEQSLLKRHIPYSVWGGARFFERKEIKDVISYLRLVASDSDNMAFRRIVNLPARKFGDTSLKNLTKIVEATGEPLMTTLRDNISNKAFAKPPLRQFIELIDAARAKFQVTKA